MIYYLIQHTGKLLPLYKSEKRKQRLSPYSETELWDRDEILSIVKYEPYKRNKARFNFALGFGCIWTFLVELSS